MTRFLIRLAMVPASKSEHGEIPTFRDVIADVVDITEAEFLMFLDKMESESTLDFCCEHPRWIRSAWDTSDQVSITSVREIDNSAIIPDLVFKRLDGKIDIFTVRQDCFLHACDGAIPCARE